jgi:hypothetical protein
MYYGTSLDMEVKPTIACNEAILEAQSVIGAAAPAADTVAPTVWVPQRFPWNPGSVNFGPMYGYQQSISNGDFTVWTFVHDVSGTSSVVLKYRIDADGANPLSSNENETFAGGAGVGAWQAIPMTRRAFPAGNVFNNPGINFTEMPTAIADQWHAQVNGIRSKLVDYYVEATDARGNVRKSAIQHVWVGDGNGAGGGGGGGGGVVAVTPDPLVAGAGATVSYNPAGRALAGASTVRLHYGYNDWSIVASPDATMSWNAKTQRWTATVPLIASASQFDFAFTNGTGTWDNNAGNDWHYPVTGTQGSDAWTLDGVRDTDAFEIASNAAGTRRLWAGIKGSTLYVASDDAGEGDDVFIFVASPVGALRAAPWSKAGQVASWTAFLADENDNDYEGWFNQLGSSLSGGAAPAAATGPNGGVVEGTIDFAGLFGTAPVQLSLAVGPFGTLNGGALKPLGQAPASSNGNTTLDAIEYVTVATCGITVIAGGGNACCPADIDRDGAVGSSDLGQLLSAWGTNSAAADLDRDGSVGSSDLGILLSSWGGC